MRKKRYKRKGIKANKKILIGLFICLALVLFNFSLGHKSEAITIFNENQPIQIMYSIMMVSKTEQMNDTRTSREPYFNIFQSGKTSKKKQSEQPQHEQKSKPVEDTNKQGTVPPKEKKEPEKPVNQTINPKTVYLTFDDGPSEYTLSILETLKSYDMKATFFMLEPNMRAYPDKLNAIIANGHVPALHGVSHRVSKIYRSEKTVVDEMTQAQQTLINLTGNVTHLIRTPYGSSPYMKPSYKEAVKKAGFQLWDWTIDSEDWKFQNAKYVSHVIKQLENYKYPESPIIILLHDRGSTAEHLPILLEYLKSHGYKAELLNESLAAYNFR